MATNKWIPIVVGSVIFVVLVGTGLIGGFAYMVARRVQVQEMTASGGQEEFD
jgi:threonine dehydrogenase-like Zn-dependent dehydrogenase